jgi:hypothetical protein
MAFSFCLSDPSFKTALKGKPDWNGPLACSFCGNHVEKLANNFASAVVLLMVALGVWY